MTPHSSRVADASAIALSGLCLVHCLALPFIAVSLPIVGAFAEAEWIHKALVLAALPLTGFVIWQSLNKQFEPGFTLLAVAGLAQLFAAAFIEPLHDYEKSLTFLGATMLAAAHLWRWSKHTY